MYTTHMHTHYTHAHMHTHYTHAHTLHTCTHTCTHITHAHTPHTHTHHTHAHMHTCTHTTHMHTHHTHAHTPHTCTHTHMHTHATHMHIQVTQFVDTPVGCCYTFWSLCSGSGFNYSGLGFFASFIFICGDLLVTLWWLWSMICGVLQPAGCFLVVKDINLASVTYPYPSTTSHTGLAFLP